MKSDQRAYPFCDLSLARRLERTEGASNAEFVETRARLFPDSGARWIEVAGTCAMYDGTMSPLTQTFGLGLFEPVTPAVLDTVEAFYDRLGAPVFHEVCPLADAALLGLLSDRGYRPIELSSVMFRPVRLALEVPAERTSRIQVRQIDAAEADLWAQTGARGWSEFTEVAGVVGELMRITAMRPGAPSFLAEIDGQPVAAGALYLHAGVALLAGASTIPEARRQGAQLALLEARLRFAAEQDCDIAMMCAQPGSASQRNAEHHGFRIAYTRIKWCRAGGSQK